MIIKINLPLLTRRVLSEKWSTVARAAAATFVSNWENGRFSLKHWDMTSAEENSLSIIRRSSDTLTRVNALAKEWTERKVIAMPTYPWVRDSGKPLFSQDPATFSVGLYRGDFAELFCTWFYLMEECGINGGLTITNFVPFEARELAKELYAKFLVDVSCTANVAMEAVTVAFLSQVSPNYF